MSAILNWTASQYSMPTPRKMLWLIEKFFERFKLICNADATLQALAITPAREFIQIKAVPAAAASFVVPRPRIIMKGTR